MSLDPIVKRVVGACQPYAWSLPEQSHGLQRCSATCATVRCDACALPLLCAVDAPVPQAPYGLRVAAVVGLATFLGAAVYAKFTAPKAIEHRVFRDMFTADSKAE